MFSFFLYIFSSSTKAIGEEDFKVNFKKITKWFHLVILETSHMFSPLSLVFKLKGHSKMLLHVGCMRPSHINNRL